MIAGPLRPTGLQLSLLAITFLQGQYLASAPAWCARRRPPFGASKCHRSARLQRHEFKPMEKYVDHVEKTDQTLGRH